MYAAPSVTTAETRCRVTAAEARCRVTAAEARCRVTAAETRCRVERELLHSWRVFPLTFSGPAVLLEMTWWRPPL